MPDHSGAAAVDRVAERPGGGRSLLDVRGLDVPAATGLGCQQPDDATRVECGQGVHEGVDQVAVTVTPPEQHHVDDVVVALVDERAAGDLLDRGAQHGVAVLVEADFLDHLSRLNAEAGGGLTLLFGRVRGRTHENPPLRRGPAITGGRWW